MKRDEYLTDRPMSRTLQTLLDLMLAAMIALGLLAAIANWWL